MRCILSLCTIVILFGTSAQCFAADADEPVAVISALSVFAGAADARPVQVGEWVEYLISHPADPLRYSLQPDPPASNSESSEFDTANEPSALISENMFFIEPSFEPPVIWRSLPLRLEIRAIEQNGCSARMSFGSMQRDVFLPLEQKPGVPLYYDEPQPPAITSQYKIGNTVFPVETIRKNAPGLGFVRMGSADLPFGLARFATEKVDIALVGMGDANDMPPFPLPLPDGMTPAPGQAYQRQRVE